MCILHAFAHLVWFCVVFLLSVSSGHGSWHDVGTGEEERTGLLGAYHAIPAAPLAAEVIILADSSSEGEGEG